MTLAASGLVVFYPFILPACIILKMLSIPVLLYPTAIALKTAYDGKYGAPSAGAPKVFVKYFYVNTATGEKSGEMLGVATLSSSEENGD